MRHALITTHLLHQARDAAIAQAAADERLEHQTGVRPAPGPPSPAASPGSSPWPAASAAWRHGPPDRRPDRTRKRVRSVHRTNSAPGPRPPGPPASWRGRGGPARARPGRRYPRVGRWRRRGPPTISPAWSCSACRQSWTRPRRYTALASSSRSSPARGPIGRPATRRCRPVCRLNQSQVRHHQAFTQPARPSGTNFLP